MIFRRFVIPKVSYFRVSRVGGVSVRVRIRNVEPSEYRPIIAVHSYSSRRVVLFVVTRRTH